LALTLLGLALIVGVALAASESLRNDSGHTASGIVVHFSQSVRITSWDTATFSTCSPTSGRAESFTFSGGELVAGSGFRVSWSPSDATVTTVEWLAAAAAPPETTMGLETASDTPTVAGDLLNAACFAHAAYVMQGVSDFSPTGARRNEWVMPLRVYGPDGAAGHACLEGQLLSYSDYGIGWNVVSTGRVVVDCISVVDMSTGDEVAGEDFEAWR